MSHASSSMTTAAQYQDEIFACITRGDALSLQLMLSTFGAKPNLDFFNDAGETPLLLAIKAFNPEIVKILLTFGEVDLDMSGEDDVTPLAQSFRSYVFWRSEERDASEAEILEHRKAVETIARLLLASGAHPSLSDFKGKTPLIRAIENCFDDIALELIAHPKCLINMITRDGKTAYNTAIRYDSQSVLAALLERDIKKR